MHEIGKENEVGATDSNVLLEFLKSEHMLVASIQMLRNADLERRFIEEQRDYTRRMQQVNCTESLEGAGKR